MDANENMYCIFSNFSVFLEWLIETNRSADFETLPDEILAGILREFFGAVRKQSQKEYSRSGLINLRAGLNRYLQDPPNRCIINLMHNPIFQNANKVFYGHMRVNKQKGLDVSRPKEPISQADLEKVYEYFQAGLVNGDLQILQHKVFFDLMYFTGRRGKQGLWDLTKDSFALKETADGSKFIEITFNEVTKTNQGDNNSAAANSLHNNHSVIMSQPNSTQCLVNSFKHYCGLLNTNLNAFFQRVNKNGTKYDKAPLGVNTLATMMKVISKRAGLSRIHTNHEICKTTCTGLKRKGVQTHDIAQHTKHKNIQSLEHYIAGPTIEEKAVNSNKLFEYANPRNDAENEDPQPEEGAIAQIPPNNNILPENAVIPFKPHIVNNENNEVDIPPAIPNQQNNSQVVNQLKQAPMLFSGATFNNCTIQLNVPQ